MALSLEDKVAVVTGATGAVGAALARGLRERGAVVCLVVRDRTRLERSLSNIGESDRVRIYEADLLVVAQIRELAGRLARDLDHVDILAHCAGTIDLAPVAEARVDEFDRQYALNVRAPYTLTSFVLPLLKPSGGDVVFINSTAGLVAQRGFSQYAATKHALKALADSLREEVNEDRIRVLSVFLGRTASRMQEMVHDLEGKPYHPERLIQPDDVATAVISALLLPRTAELTEIRIRPFEKPRSH